MSATTSAIRRAPDWAAILVVAAIAWPAFAFGGVYPWGYHLLFVLCGLVLVAGVVAGERRADRALTACAAAVAIAVALQLIPWPAPVLAALSPATVAFLAGHDVEYVMTVAAGAPVAHPLSVTPDATRRFLWFFAALAALFAGVRALGARRSLRGVVTSITVIGALLALVGIVQAGADSNLMYGIWAPLTPTAAVAGPFVNRNHFATWMLMALPIAMTQCAASMRAAQRQAPARPRLSELAGTPAASQVVLTVFAVLVMAVALLMTQSRSGIGGLAVVTIAVIGLYLSRQWRARETWPAVLVVLTVIVVAVAWMGWEPLVARFDELPGSRFSGRLDAWDEGARIARDFWLTGSGLNSYAAVMLAYHDPAIPLYFRTPHNDYLQAVSDGGLLVTVPLALLGVVLARRIAGALRRSATGPSFEAWTRGGAVVGLGAVALQELVDFGLQTPANAVLFVVLAAYAASDVVRPARRDVTEP